MGPRVALEAVVVDSHGAALEAWIHVRPVVDGLELFRVVALPDTQFYTEADASNTIFVSHLGDLVQDWDVESQWQVADDALSLIESILPYGIV